jgi:hypothetical protein
MQRIEFNVSTGERKTVDLTPEEIADAQARTAVENATAPLREMERLERENPITHRALREFFIGFGEAQPAFKETLLYKRAKAADDAIKLEREKL